ncbi:hypothetical protein [Priestia megaterium]|uniref:hypothetical protein n=1 Tax=Priestia megaterium TaxID=1404 RepID=UPI000BF25243|nr:hypothetical protein [Priestia megaterium]PFT58081.1 hypothetical protein COK68_00695 [Priestia megaterium]
MTQVLEINNTIEEVELQEKLYPMRENWDLLKPYLNDDDVQAVLNEAMTAFCEEHPKYGKIWTPGDAPWDYITSCYWHDRIFDAVQEDENFQKEQDELFQKLYGSNSDDEDEDDLWNELLNAEEYQLLDLKYYNKHAPQKDSMEWYQFIHGCHWINQFTAALVSKALNVEAYVLHTTTHTCATFVKDDVVYYADVQLEWENLQELLDFLGEEVDLYPVFDGTE